MGDNTTITVPRGQLANVKVSYTLNQAQLKAPLKEGQAIGMIDYQINGKPIEQNSLLVMETVNEGGFFSRM